MRYKDISCGLRVRLLSGRVGTVTSFEGSWPALEVLINQSVKPKNSMLATVKLENGDEVRAKIRSLAKAKEDTNE